MANLKRMDRYFQDTFRGVFGRAAVLVRDPEGETPNELLLIWKGDTPYEGEVLGFLTFEPPERWTAWEPVFWADPSVGIFSMFEPGEAKTTSEDPTKIVKFLLDHRYERERADALEYVAETEFEY